VLAGLLLENFKAFGRRQFIPLAPITLIYGTNSAGKSSIIQALALLKQSIEPLDLEATIVTRGSLVDLGNYYDLVYQHETSREIEIATFFNLRRAGNSFRLVIPKEIRHLAGLGARLGYNSQTRSISVTSIPVYLDSSASPAYSLVPESLPPRRGLGRERESAELVVSDLDFRLPFWEMTYHRIQEENLDSVRSDLEESIARATSPRGDPSEIDLEAIFQAADPNDDHRPLRDALEEDRRRRLNLLRKYLQRFTNYSIRHFEEDMLDYTAMPAGHRYGDSCRIRPTPLFASRTRAWRVGTTETLNTTSSPGSCRGIVGCPTCSESP
jgi:hypothetical protein